MTRRQADVTLALATLIWAASFAIVKQSLRESSPLAFTAVRFGIGAAVLLPFIGLRAFTRAELKAGAVLGGLLATGFATQTVGLVYTTPARSAFIVASSSVLAPIVAFFINRERPRVWLVAALLLACAGMYLLTDPEAGGLNRGDVWTLATAVAFGAQIAAVAELSQRYDPLRLVWMETVVTAAGAAVAALLFERVRLSSTPQFLAALAYAGVLATAVALVLQTRAQRHMSATRAALIFCLEPVFATAISWFWLGERLAASQWIGGTLIVAGMLVAEVRKSSGPAS